MALAQALRQPMEAGGRADESAGGLPGDTALRLALQPCGRGETPQGDESHDALAGRLLRGHASSP